MNTIKKAILNGVELIDLSFFCSNHGISVKTPIGKILDLYEENVKKYEEMG